ncbi:MAG TPA: nuclear transport factor 2 family protein [Steroidobacteraceae bacterium]|nr:nuclear transport factor 2 family protein [Steroidobacteraceae bacterium]
MNARIRAMAGALMIAQWVAGCGDSDSLGPQAAQTAAARKAQIAALEARVDRIKDANDIKRLQRAYGFYLDKGMWDEMADLFAADATAEYAHDGVYVGQDHIRAYFKKLGHDRNGLAYGEINNHMILQGVVHVAPDGMTARARWRALIQAGEYKKSARWGEGPYEIAYVKDNGVWKIQKLHWYVTFVAPYEGGWAKVKPIDALVSPASKEVKPDRPPSESYKPYPAAYLPRYHYENPVTGASAREAPPVTTDPSLQAWDREVARLEAHDAIENLQGIYGYYFDKNQWDSLVDLFTEDATYEVGQRGVYKGKKHIRAALELIGPAGVQPGVLNNELQLQPLIHVSADGKSAKARWRTLEMKGVHGKSGMWGKGVYENEYVLQDGVWKISKLHYYLTHRGDYDKGWAKQPIPIEQVSAELPPDAPPTEVYGSPPEAYLPPYHYQNPVTHPIARPDMGAIPDDLASLAKKVSLLNDEIDVQNLQRSYGYYVDEALWDEVTELFADDATLEIGGRGVFVGKKRINEYMHFLGKQGPQPGAVFDHSQWQPITHVADDGRTAKQRLRAFVMAGSLGTPGTPAGSVFGECTYENEYVKENGVWKIAKLYAYFNMYTPYAQGWGKAALPNTHPEEKLPPDRPPTVVYQTYPTPGMVPYHYKNPVTGR